MFEDANDGDDFVIKFVKKTSERTEKYREDYTAQFRSETIFEQQEIFEEFDDFSMSRDQISRTEDSRTESVSQSYVRRKIKKTYKSTNFECDDAELTVLVRNANEQISISEDEWLALKKSKVQTIDYDEFISARDIITDNYRVVNIYEGDRIYVIKKHTQDWWFVRKILTNEIGFIPARVLFDTDGYAELLVDKINRMIDQLPIYVDIKDDLIEPPSFIKSIGDSVAYDGDSFTFTCKISGRPRPTVTWFKESHIIKPVGDFEIYYDEDNVCRLVISELYPEDAGTYTLVLKNIAGIATASAELKVLIKESEATDYHGRKSRLNSFSDTVCWSGVPPVFTGPIDHIIVDMGGTIVIECKVSGEPRPDVKFVFNGKVIRRTTKNVEILEEKEEFLYKHTLKISKATIYNSGIYEVLAENSEGRATMTANVTVKRDEVPLIIERFKSQTVFEREPAVFIIKFSGFPVPEIKWFHKGLRIYSNEYLKIKKQECISRLEISCTNSQRDSGIYKCKLINEFGSVEHEAQLTVQIPQIEFIEKLTDLEAIEREDVLFIVKLSDSNAKVIWKKEYRQLEEDESKYKMIKEDCYFKLLIRDINIFDEGEYSCQIEKTRQTCCSYLVVIELPPEIITGLKDVTVPKGKPIRLSIELTKGDALVKWYKNNKEIVFDHRVRLKINGKRQELVIYKSTFEDAAIYKCEVGDQVSSCRVTIETASVEFSEDIERMEIETTEMTERSTDGLYSLFNFVLHRL